MTLCDRNSAYYKKQMFLEVSMTSGPAEKSKLFEFFLCSLITVCPNFASLSVQPLLAKKSTDCSILRKSSEEGSR